VAKFIAVSRFIREEWLSIGLEPDSIDVVHNGVDSKDYPFGGLAERARARRALGLPEDGFLALYCGRLDPVKGIEVLLDAWRLLGLDPAGNRLLVVGSPEPDAEGAAFGQALVEGAPPGCHWLPSRRDVTTPFHAADVVVVPSLVKESFGRVVVEAMVTGRPVVAARVGGIPEILDGEFSRFLFDRGDAASLADRLIAVADWREREPTLAEVCRAHVKENFTGQAMVDGIERVLLEAVRTSRNGS
jgi:glycosyltransferase involved in cell wall biosynthesis